MFLITKILDLAYVQNYMRCLSQNKSDTKLFRVYLFTLFTIKRQIYSNYYMFDKSDPPFCYFTIFTFTFVHLSDLYIFIPYDMLKVNFLICV